MIVYKLVSEYEPGMYISFNYQGIPYDFILFYELNKKTVPKYGKIFVFKTLEDAQVHCMFNNKILKCNAKNVKKFNIRPLNEFSNQFIYFWSCLKNKKSTDNISPNHRIPLPNNTYVCDSLTPIEVIKSYERLSCV